MFLRGFVNYASQSRSDSGGLQSGELRCERLDRSYQLIASNIARNMTFDGSERRQMILLALAAAALVLFSQWMK